MKTYFYQNLGYLTLVSGLTLFLSSGCNHFKKDDDSKNKGESSNHESSNQNDESEPEIDIDIEAQLYLIDAYETDDESIFVAKSPGSGLALINEDENKETKSKSILDRAVEMLFEIADVDESKSISEQEFLSFKLSDVELPSSAVDRVQEWRKFAFSEADENEDGDLDSVEARILLQHAHQYVMKLRKKRGNYEEYAKFYWESILEEYDLNKNGKLDQDERTSLRDHYRQEARDLRSEIAKDCDKTNHADRPLCKLYTSMNQLCDKVNPNNLVIRICKGFFGSSWTEKTE